MTSKGLLPGNMEELLHSKQDIKGLKEAVATLLFLWISSVAVSHREKLDHNFNGIKITRTDLIDLGKTGRS